MARSVAYDDRNLQQLFAELEPKRRLQAIKGGFRREANKVRKTAINNLRNSVRSNKDLEKGVRAIVFKRKAGFRVTVGTKKAGKNVFAVNFWRKPAMRCYSSPMPALPTSIPGTSALALFTRFSTTTPACSVNRFANRLSSISSNGFRFPMRRNGCMCPRRSGQRKPVTGRC